MLVFDKPNEKLIAAATSVAMVVLIVLVTELSPAPRSAINPSVASVEPIGVFPDFASIERVSDKKQQFFDFLQGYIDAENQKILKLRARLMPLAELAKAGDSFSVREEAFVSTVAETYKLEVDSEATHEVMAELLERVDVIPASLVLAQAANESAWGTSRFAVDGNNLFGQWCFVEGCGFVPRRRADDAIHEVKKFDSVAGAVAGYFINLNTNQSYDYMRELRSHMRAEDQPIDSMVLAFGLGRYSQRGDHYVDEVQNIILQNDLHDRDQDLTINSGA